LRSELDAEPERETVRLYETLAASEAGSAAAHVPAGPALPRPLTRFVGRRAELEALAGLLAGDDARLVTVHGLGGVGKTRLALGAARAPARASAAEAGVVPA